MGAGEVWVFGSLARGEVYEGSDLDLPVVMDTDLPFVERLARLYRKLKPGVATDLFVYTPEEMEDLREGRRLQARQPIQYKIWSHA